ncbi:hypothetical protein [Candidatus Nephthysia bennettiae]|uniref:Uncharacterized protein n=1 Tax=Candidatus Nephthysia bennettiae TaxID=3127016 RepID=A0A934K558_9BACT|nr:hypothetical protein [Candidatus Dormibacteraeota bacterium]
MLVVEVPGGAGFVAGAVLVFVWVDELVVGVWVAVVVLVEVNGVVVVLDVLVELFVEVLAELEQSRAASCLTLTAPSPRLCTSLPLTPWRLPTLLLKALAALAAAAQLLELTAADTASSWLARLLP